MQIELKKTDGGLLQDDGFNPEYRDDERILSKSLRNSGEVKILSYNIFMRPPGVSSDKLGDLKNERLHQIITDVLPHYDIICFQEVFTYLNCRKEKLVEAANQAGFAYEAFPPSHPFWSWYFINSGLLSISRHKIEISDFCNFSHGSGIDGLAYKGIQYMRILVDGKHPMNLFNLHMQAHYDKLDKKNIRSRLNQIFETRSAIEKMLRKHTGYFNLENSNNFLEPIYLIGDFNVCANLHLFEKDGYLDHNEINDHFLEFLEEFHPNDHHFVEYDYLMYILRIPMVGGRQNNKIIEMLQSKYGYHPLTFIGSIHSEFTLEDIEQMKNHDSMDFIFQIVPDGQDVDRLVLQADVRDCQVQPFAVKNRPFKYASDHLGVEFVVKVKQELVNGSTTGKAQLGLRKALP
jgi:hypothetical protein